MWTRTLGIDGIGNRLKTPESWRPSLTFVSLLVWTWWLNKYEMFGLDESQPFSFMEDKKQSYKFLGPQTFLSKFIERHLWKLAKNENILFGHAGMGDFQNFFLLQISFKNNKRTLDFMINSTWFETLALVLSSNKSRYFLRCVYLKPWTRSYLKLQNRIWLNAGIDQSEQHKLVTWLILLF